MHRGWKSELTQYFSFVESVVTFDATSRSSISRVTYLLWRHINPTNPKCWGNGWSSRPKISLAWTLQQYQQIHFAIYFITQIQDKPERLGSPSLVQRNKALQARACKSCCTLSQHPQACVRFWGGGWSVIADKREPLRTTNAWNNNTYWTHCCWISQGWRTNHNLSRQMDSWGYVFVRSKTMQRLTGLISIPWGITDLSTNAG